MKRSVLKNSVGAMCLAFAALPASAQNLPAVEDLQPIFAETLPGYWQIQGFRVVSSAAAGDPVTPLALFRFEADVKPTADLYAATGEEVGPFTVVVPTYSGQNPRTIYGTMELVYHAGEWEGAADVENPVDDLGVPLDVFKRPPLQTGSPELANMLAKLRSDTVANSRAALEAEVTALEADQKSELGKLVATHDTELALKRREYEAKLEELAAQFGPTVAAEQAKLDAELEALRTAHATKVGELKAQQAEVVAELETRLTARRERLERQLAEAQSVLDAQTKMLELVASADANDRKLQAAFEARRGDQLAYFQSFGAEMFGNMLCVADEDPQVKTEFPLYFEVTSVTATGIEGLARSQKGSRNSASVTLSLAGVNAAGANELVLSLGWKNVIGTYSMAQNENGSLVGTAKGKMVFHSESSQYVDTTCRVVIAAR